MGIQITDTAWAKGYAAAKEALRGELEWQRDEIICLRKLAGRAARAISAGCVDTEDTLALVAEFETVAEGKKSDWVQSSDGETIRENTDNSTRLHPLDYMRGKGSSDPQPSVQIEAEGRKVTTEPTTLRRVMDCALMAHSLGSSFPITSVGWNQASKLERELNETAAELRKKVNS